MSFDLNYLVLHSLKYEHSPRGSLAIRRAALPRVVRSIISGVIALVIAYILVPITLAPYMAVLATAGAFWFFGRPYAEFDVDSRVMSFGRRRIPFDEVGQVHMIERHDEKEQNAGLGRLLRGAELVTCYEVYARVNEKPLIIAEFPSKKAAANLVDGINRVIVVGQ